LNVLGALLSCGTTFFATLSQTVTAELIAGFLGLLREHAGTDRPLVAAVAGTRKSLEARCAAS
jgi:hypothetical protein